MSMRFVWLVIGNLVLLALGCWIALNEAPRLPDLLQNRPGGRSEAHLGF